jgi:hypothetical protein
VFAAAVIRQYRLESGFKSAFGGLCHGANLYLSEALVKETSFPLTDPPAV